MQRFVPVLFSLCLASSAGGLPLLSEVFYDASGSDNGAVFVELYGMPGTSLEGMVLEGVNGADGAVGPTVPLSGVVPADGLFVVADDSGDGTTLVPGADLVVNFDFQNGHQTQAKSIRYVLSAARFWGACASAQGEVCA